MPVATDVEHVLMLVRRGHVAAAVDAYGGDLLPGTNSPALTELGEYVAVAVREALLADPDPDAVLRYAERAPYDTAVMERCLAVLGDTGPPGQAVAQGPAGGRPRAEPPVPRSGFSAARRATGRRRAVTRAS